MDNEVSPERARQVLDMLTAGGSMDHINTPLALRLIPLAHEVERDDLVDRLLEHAATVATNDEERGWARFEAMKTMNADVESFLHLAESAESMADAQGFTAAVHHYIALMHLAEGRLDEARTSAQRALVLRNALEDVEGRSYGLALLMTIAKRQHDDSTAIAIGTERLELFMTANDEYGQMEALADLAHCQATVGELDAARDLFNRSLELAKNIGSLSGQLVASWGLADLSEIEQQYETAMLTLSDCLHEFMALDVPAPAQLRQRIHDLTQLRDQPSSNDDEASSPY